jgi:ElaB/YqjD/DUF883 family membrane-anchored ribosome-binding protein
VDNELEVIRHQMEAKRASLSDKLDALENQVLETAHEATSAVTQIAKDVTEVVDNVTEDIQETVQSVKDTFDIGEKIRQNPWTSIAGAFAVGFAGAYLIGSAKRSAPAHSELHFPRTNGFTPHTEPARAFVNEPKETAKEPPKETSESSSSLTSLLGIVGTETMNKVKGLAVGTLMGVLAEVVVNAVPTSLKTEVTNLMTDLNTQLGGKALFTLDKSEQGTQPAEQQQGEPSEYGNKAEVGRPMGSAQGASQEPVGQSDRRRAETGRRRL